MLLVCLKKKRNVGRYGVIRSRSASVFLESSTSTPEIIIDKMKVRVESKRQGESFPDRVRVEWWSGCCADKLLLHLTKTEDKHRLSKSETLVCMSESLVSYRIGLPHQQED
ncbi:hypothetical protein KSS87_011329 [Heliosperma pusillum]|nr:hypothetical protein KSS87_011329 [Heliosperma pusillum]